MMCILPPPAAWRLLRLAKKALGDQRVVPDSDCSPARLLPDCSPARQTRLTPLETRAQEDGDGDDRGDAEAIRCLASKFPLKGAPGAGGDKPLRDALCLLERLASLSASRTAGKQAVGELLGRNAALHLLRSFPALDDEAGNIALHVLDAFLRLADVCGLSDTVAAHVAPQAASILEALLAGCACSTAAAHSGAALRALAAAHSKVAAAFLEAGAAERLVGIMLEDGCCCEVSLEAFASLRGLLLAQKATSAAYLEMHFDSFMERYHKLLEIDDYVVKRQALRLLGDVLLDRSFMRVMVRYIGTDVFLRIHMNMLRDPSRWIPIEAFHVFKLFVGNPRKSRNVHVILYRNRDRLVRFLDGMSRRGGPALTEDVQVVANTIRLIAPPMP